MAILFSDIHPCTLICIDLYAVAVPIPLRSRLHIFQSHHQMVYKTSCSRGPRHVMHHWCWGEVKVAVGLFCSSSGVAVRYLEAFLTRGLRCWPQVILETLLSSSSSFLSNGPQVHSTISGARSCNTIFVILMIHCLQLCFCWQCAQADLCGALCHADGWHEPIKRNKPHLQL